MECSNDWPQEKRHSNTAIMKTIITVAIFLTSITMNAQEVYDFSLTSNLNDWYVVDDGVMGGRSNGSIAYSSEGHGIFQGDVSLENNGGFTSIRHRMNVIETKGYNMFRLRIKGDGKNYQFRVKTNLRDYQSYVYEFETTGEWQEISIPFDQMYPTFRGMKLDMPNYPGESLRECTFLISNKKEERFHLKIDKIWLDKY